MRERWEKFKQSRSFSEFYFFALALILAFGTLQFTGTALSTEKPVVSVVSCSMYPQLNVGDILIVRGTDFEDIQEGDVIVYQVEETRISIQGQSYRLHTYTGDGDTARTPVGDVEFRGIRQVDDGSATPRTVAVLSVKGKTLALSEGQTARIDGQTLRVDSIEGMNIPVVHRVTQKGSTSLETKGDNNPRQLEFENDVEPQQIHGKVLFRIPRIGGLKLLAMDFAGLGGPRDAPIAIDSYPSCRIKVPLGQR